MAFDPAKTYLRLKQRLTRLHILPLGITSIVIVVNLLVLALPFGSFYLFRLYEDMPGGKRMWTVGAGIVLLTLFIALTTSWTLARPIHRLTARIRQMAAGDMGAIDAIEVHGTREVALLTRNFAGMARALEGRSQYIRQFATHVSHEFKTPLTSIRGAAELLDEHGDDMSAEERRRFVGNIIADSERMRDLVNRLMELARADNPPLGKERAELAEVIAGLQARHAQAGLRIVSALPATPLWLALSQEALAVVLSNLADNARQHAASELRIEATQSGDGMAELVVSDNGSGISPGNREKVFEPFFTTRRSEGGTGLGLGIVRALIGNHGGSIRLDPVNRETSFRLSLPLADSSTATTGA